MASAISQNALGAGITSGYWDGMPTNNVTLADQTGNSAFQTFNASIRAVRAFIWQKNFAGTASLVPTGNIIYQIQVADNLAGTTNIRTVSTYVAARTPNAFVMNGIVPDDNKNTQWARMNVFLPGADAISYDVAFSAT